MSKTLKNITCILVDDEAPARKVVEKYLEDIPGFTILAQCKNAFEAMEALQTQKPDLMFLDISMPKFTGLQLLKTLDHAPLVIITSAYREYAIEGFELDVVDYLHKPFSFERFLKAINKVRTRLEPSAPIPVPQETSVQIAQNYIFIKEDKRNYRVDIQDILYVHADADYMNVVTPKHTYYVYMTMKKMETILPETHFIRIHKSYIVNLSKVTAFEGNRILIDKVALPLGSGHRDHFYLRVKESSL